jgi:hypothetical protein
MTVVTKVTFREEPGFRNIVNEMLIDQENYVA